MELKNHKGHIVKEIVGVSGYTLVAVARKMKMSRNTLYNRFKRHDLSPAFLFKLGRAINYDFTKKFPELCESEVYLDAQESGVQYGKEANQEFMEVKVKYYQTLEEYNKLLKFLVKIINGNELYSLKKEIDHFVNRNFK